jgi:hypothetical protein
MDENTAAIVAELQKLNQTTRDILMAITTQVIAVKIVDANSPPQYTGPTTLNAVTAVPVQLQGMDPDGDPIKWTVDANQYATITQGGLLSPLKATPKDAQGNALPVNITIHLDDGKT